MRYINNRGFYYNFKQAISNLDEQPEYGEYKNFLVNGESLNFEGQLLREKNRILLDFIHFSGLEFNFVKYNSFKKTIDQLSNVIDSQEYDYETIKCVIVHLDLELGIDPMFSTTASWMAKKGIKNIKDYSKFDEFNFENLYNEYSNDFNKRLR